MFLKTKVSLSLNKNLCMTNETKRLEQVNDYFEYLVTLNRADPRLIKDADKPKTLEELQVMISEQLETEMKLRTQAAALARIAASKEAEGQDGEGAAAASSAATSGPQMVGARVAAVAAPQAGDNTIFGRENARRAEARNIFAGMSAPSWFPIELSARMPLPLAPPGAMVDGAAVAP